MEGIHGVDVSWLHHSNRDQPHRLHSAKSLAVSKNAPSKPATSGGLPVQPPAAANGTPERGATGVSTKDMAAGPSPAPDGATPTKAGLKRPGLMGRMPSDKSASTVSTTSSEGSGKSAPRKNSWIKNLKDQFGGSPQNAQASNLAAVAKTVTNGSQANGSPAQASWRTPTKDSPAPRPQPPVEEVEDTPAMEKSPRGSFFSSALRRLSSNSTSSPQGQLYPKGGLCPRRVMNIDMNRERCQMKELDPSKLRKVSFCVDVEIVGGTRYKDDADPAKKAAKFKDQKLKEKGEGAALKHPHELADEKDKSGVVAGEDVGTPATPNPEGTTDTAAQQAQEADAAAEEKKARALEEKRERSERKRKKAEENGSLPREFVRGSDSSPQASQPPTPRPQDRPTTDPVRIYRRCCQLRESPILKRITEQLSNPQACPINTPGVVTCLNLTGSRLQLPDVVALSDWLAVVPVKRLLLEDADLTDEGVRVILAGLLAAKPPDQQRSHRRLQTAGVTRGQLDDAELHKESLGIIEKLSLKNNPRLTVEAWKHISLFIYMCRSIKAIDLSTNKFPNAAAGAGGTLGLAEIFGKALSTRLAGSHLEELMMAECSLTTPSIKRIVDAAEMCGVNRLGLASNNLDDEALDAVVRYVRSGICEGLDIGGNDLRERIPKLIEAFTDNSPIWALSLADCKLSVDSLRPLFPALMKLHNFRFLDLSHNHDLFGKQPDALPILRRYVPQLPLLKRLHLIDCALEPRQAIGLAEIIPETELLAHLNLLENPSLARLASATSEEDQEEACALYASLMAAARVSNSIIAIDIDVPTPESSDLVKALAKQVVAYCLRNMERWAVTETQDSQDAVAAATEAHGGAESMKDIEVPEVILHLVGHVEGSHENHDNDDPAPDEDYIVGGTGVVKILNYCLGEQANEMRRESLQASGSNSGSATPARRIDKGSAEASEGKAKKLSLDMLGSARKIRMRLRPALVKESKSGDDMAYRRLQFLDSTLQNIIDRFEAEYPETRIIDGPQSDVASGSPATTTSSSAPTPALSSSVESGQLTGDPSLETSSSSAVAEDLTDDEDYGSGLRRSRQGSQVSLAGRMMGFEEGRIHKLGQHIRRDILKPGQDEPERGAGSGVTTAPVASTSDGSSPATNASRSSPTAVVGAGVEDGEDTEAAVARLYRRLESLQGAELRDCLREIGYEQVLKNIGNNVEELRKLRRAAEMGGLGPEEEESWAAFREAQEKAQRNAMREGEEVGHGAGDSAVED